MKKDQEVIKDFNELVNMTAPELEKWLNKPDSKNAGWAKDDGSGESIGHESGNKIVDILKANPNKKPGNYSEDQIQHMRKVVAYCKRHLAQEQNSLDKKSNAEAKKTQSYKSLMNWGHDPLKKSKDDTEENGTDGTKKTAGNKRKSTGTNKTESISKRQTRSSTKAKKEEEDTESEKDEDTESDEDEGSNKQNTSDKGKGSNKAGSKTGAGPGDKVSWNWGQGQPEGRIKDIKHKDAEITTKRGNKVSRKGTSKDPAVILDAGKSDAIKLAHEINESIEG